MTEAIYLDNSATTPMDPDVLRWMTESMVSVYGNPSSLHRLGGAAEQMLSQARKTLAKGLDVKESEIVFTSGGTESNNTAVQGICRRYASRGRHLITTQIEHPSVLEAFRAMEREGFTVTYLPPGADGRIRTADVADSIRKDTILVSIMHVNNETGAIQPVEAVAALIRTHRKVFFHVDAVQSFGRMPIPVRAGIDLLSASAHKIHGPKGIGLLFIREGCEPLPLLYGGGQEKGRRSGTENAPAASAFALALTKVAQQPMNGLRALRNHLADRLAREDLDIVWNSPLEDEHAAPHILNVSFPGIKGEVLVHALEERGVYVSTGSACSSRQSKGSHVLRAMGRSEEEVAGSIRFSLSHWNTREQIDQAVEHVAAAVRELRQWIRR
jgi:cysteine desulfurase